MSKPFAVFDIDGTLIRWQLMHATFNELGKRGLLEATSHQTIQAARKRWKERAGEEAFREYEKTLVTVIESSLQSIDVAAFQEANQAILDEYKDQVYRYTRELIHDLKQRGYTLFAISGSQDLIVQPLAEHYGFDDVVGTHFEQRSGKFTGNIELTVHNKPALLKLLAEKHGVDFTDSIGVGDSEGDISILEMVNHPIAFNPSKKLFQHARERGWRIVLERKNMIYELEAEHGKYLLAQTNAG